MYWGREIIRDDRRTETGKLSKIIKGEGHCFLPWRPPYIYN